MFSITLEAAKSAAMVKYIMPEGCTKSLYGSMKMIAAFAGLRLEIDMAVTVRFSFWLVIIQSWYLFITEEVFRTRENAAKLCNSAWPPFGYFRSHTADTS